MNCDFTNPPTLFDSDLEEFLHECEQRKRDTLQPQEQPHIRWVNTGWWDQRQCYIIDYYEGGVRRASMLGYPDHRRNCFRLYPFKLAPCGIAFPPVKTVDFRYVKEEHHA